MPPRKSKRQHAEYVEAEDLTEAERSARDQRAEQLAASPQRKHKKQRPSRDDMEYVLAVSKSTDTELRAFIHAGRRGTRWEQAPIPPTPQKLIGTTRANLPNLIGDSPAPRRFATNSPALQRQNTNFLPDDLVIDVGDQERGGSTVPIVIEVGATQHQRVWFLGNIH